MRLAFTLCLLPILLPAQRLDTLFGQHGLQCIHLDWFDEPTTIVALPDQKIIVLANATPDGVDWDFALLRRLPDGAADATFGNGGMIRGDFPGFPNSQARAMAVGADGSIFVLGDGADSSGQSAFVLEKFFPDGAPDPSFAQNGMSEQHFLSKNDHARALKIAHDGKIVATGVSYDAAGQEFPVAARWLPSGALDSTFGGTGKVAVNFLTGVFPTLAGPPTAADRHANGGFFQQIEPLPDGKILLAGAFHNGLYYENVLLRLRPDARADSTFNAVGFLRLDAEPGHQQSIDALAMLPDGRAAMASNHSNPSGGATEFEVFTSGNAPNPPEAVDLPASVPFETVAALFSASDGTLWAAGNSTSAANFGPAWLSDNGFAIRFREKNDGSWAADAGFGAQGCFTFSFDSAGTAQSGIRALAEQSGGKMLALGFVFDPSASGNLGDIVLARVAMPSAASTSDAPRQPDAAPRIFPNPAHGTLFLQRENAAQEQQTADLTLFDATGRCVKTARAAAHLDALGLPAGAYFLKIEIGGKAWMRPVFLR